MSRSRADLFKEISVTVFGSGYLRPAPGTWGSAVACVCYAGVWWLLAYLGAPRWVLEVLVLWGILKCSILSGLFGEWAIAKFGRKDPSHFVLDEFAGQWVALLLLPPIAAAGFWAFCWVVGGQFVLFRLMDIIKPPPARQLERLPAGWGILCDDLMAGVYALLIGQYLWRATSIASWLGLGAGS